MGVHWSTQLFMTQDGGHFAFIEYIRFQGYLEVSIPVISY